MEEWKEYKLGDVCNILGRIGFRGYTTEDLTNNPKDGAISLSPTNIVSGELDLSKPTYIKWPKYYESPEIMIEKDDIIVVKTGSSIGRTTRIREVLHPMTINPQFVVLKEININKVFLSYVIKSPYFQALLKSITVGSAIPTLSQKNLSKLAIKIPKLDSQKRIASILKSLDDKIECNRKINENLEQQAQALFKSWFVDFEPFRDQPFVDSELGKIPQGWRVGTLSEIALINPSRILKKGQDATYLDMKNMPTIGSFPQKLETKEYNGGMRFQNCDTLMARITPCLENGKVAYVNFLDDGEIAFGSTEYIVMTTKDGVMPEILYFLCRDDDFKGYATKNMNGSSGRQRVSGETIGNYMIAIPPKSVLKPLAPFFRGIMEEIRKNGFESRRLAELRDTLLPRLMSGELKVNEISYG